MLEARFGRMRVGSCITESHNMGCYTDVIAYLDQKCSGRQYCSLDVLDLTPISVGCPKEVFSYLHAAYKCASCE